MAHGRESSRAATIRLVEAKRQAGLCLGTGCRTPVYDVAHCPECREKMRVRAAELKAKHQSLRLNLVCKRKSRK